MGRDNRDVAYEKDLEEALNLCSHVPGMAKFGVQLLHCYRKGGNIYLGTCPTEWAKRFTDIPLSQGKTNKNTDSVLMSLRLQHSVTTHTCVPMPFLLSGSALK